MNEEVLKKQIKQELKQEMKNEKRKKRRIAFIIALVIITVVLGVCIIQSNSGKTKMYSMQELEQYKTEIAITTENWEEYIVLEDIDVEGKDAFGKLTNKTESTVMRLKENICGYVIIKFQTNNDTEEIVTLLGGRDYKDYYLSQLNMSSTTRIEGDISIYNNRYTINDLECIQIIGHLYIIDIPDNLWRIDSYYNKESIRLSNYKNNGSWLMLLRETDAELEEQGNYNYIRALSNYEYEKYQEENETKY